MSFESLSALVQVILVDLVLAGDNAIAVGLVAASVKPDIRMRVISIGIAVAVILRIVFAVSITQLLKVPGLLFIGGLLLVWVGWKLFVQIRSSRKTQNKAHSMREHNEQLSFKSALFQIIVADFSMSLDNVLALAGIARNHVLILIFGLVLSVVLMLIAATAIANQINKRAWIGYLGVAIIFYVACIMTWEGAWEIKAKFFA